MSQYRPTDLVSAPPVDLARENERLSLESRILKEQREILKKHVLSLSKGPPSSSQASGREVRIRAQLAPCLPVEMLCRVMQVSAPVTDPSRHGRQADGHAVTSKCGLTSVTNKASIPAAQFTLSARPAGSRRGRPRMTMELKQAGLVVGERRVGRFMRIMA